MGRARASGKATIAGIVAATVEAGPATRRRAVAGAGVALTGASLSGPGVLPANGVGATSAPPCVLPAGLLPGVPKRQEVRNSKPRYADTHVVSQQCSLQGKPRREQHIPYEPHDHAPHKYEASDKRQAPRAKRHAPSGTPVGRRWGAGRAQGKRRPAGARNVILCRVGATVGPAGRSYSRCRRGQGPGRPLHSCLPSCTPRRGRRGAAFRLITVLKNLVCRRRLSVWLGSAAWSGTLTHFGGGPRSGRLSCPFRRARASSQS